MKCQECEELLSLYGDGDCTVREAASIDAHLATCTGCAAAWAAHEAMLSALSAWPVERAPEDAWARMQATLMTEAAPGVSTSPVVQEVPLGLPHSLPVAAASPTPTNTSAPTLWEQLWAGWQALLLPAALAGLVMLALPWSPQVQQSPHGVAGRTATPTKRLRTALRRVAPKAVALRPQTRRAAPQVRPQRPRPTAGERAAVLAALHSLGVAQQQYQKALTSLEKVARQKLQRQRAMPRSRHLMRLLAQIDVAIAHTRQTIRRTPKATQAHRVLVAMYQRKVEILRDVVLDE